MNKRNIGYWAVTGLVAAAFVAGGAGDLSHAPGMLAAMAHLGYPAYFLTILGVWKVLGAVAIAAPRFPRLKEWAYAGMIFNLTGASISHAASGDPAGNVLVPLALAALVVTSWALRPAGRVLASTPVRIERAPADSREQQDVRLAA